MKKIIILFCFVFFLNASASADEIHVAVASNFKYTLQKLADAFKEKTGHDLVISSASSGKLFTQIIHGAPYDVFLSADEKRVDLLIEEHMAADKNAYVYALGRLVLYSNLEQSADCKTILHSSRLRHLAIANPKIAPYGAAAKQVLEKLGLWQQLKPRLVMGENIAQTFQFVSTGNAQAGFIARSMLDMGEINDHACIWDIPTDMYSKINQKMVALKRSKKKIPVEAFMRYIRSAEARAIIRANGYDVL